ncbi:DUF222 domain-containing protein [Sinomonas sp. P47F7]|uniref:HNH endonuclease signature motif containing protein n=1 Tax=Sinomonas sp. P47F7 TaxID=3410987 RepID=UPI003BF57F60
MGGLVETVQGLEEAEARIHAVRAYALSQLCEHFRLTARDALEAAEAPGLAAAEVAAALNVSQRTGRAMVEDALALADPALAPVLDALGAGRLDRRRARAVAEHAAILAPGKDAAFAEAAVRIACPEDPSRAPSPGALSRRLRRLAEDYHSEPLAARKAHATAFRKVDLEPTRDGMCWITAYLPLEAGAAVDARLEAFARSLQGPGEERGVSQLRADVFRDLLLHGITDPAPEAARGRPLAGAGPDAAPVGAGLEDAPAGGGPVPSPAGAGLDASPASGWEDLPVGGGPVPSPARLAAGGVRMEVVVTVPATTLTGESETPGELLGYGPLDATAARELAAEAATWTTMYVNPSTGAPLAVGRRRYAPSLAMRRFLGARDRTCRFPGCDKPAPSTEADHTTEWRYGGTTDAGNLALLCREHHRLKTLGHWQVTHVSPASGRPPASAQHLAARLPAAHPPAAHLPAAHLPAPPSGGVLEWTSPTGRRYTTYPEADPPPPF